MTDKDFFSHSVGCLFTLRVASFAMQTLFDFVKFYLPFLATIS